MNKSYQAKFEHKTAVGGKDALNAIRSKLLRLYADKSNLAPTPVIPPPPPAPTSGSYVPPPPAPATQIPETPSPAAPDSNQQQITVPGLIDATRDIPDEFKVIVRRSRKRLTEVSHPALLKAFNAFSSALNQGVSISELQDLGDTLDDVFREPYDPPTILEPIMEVPAQFKSIVRRAHKQLIEQLDPELLKAFNTFVQGLNSGVSEADLENLGDQLDNIYDNVRKR